MKNLVKDRNIASITPTSQAGVREVCKKMNLNKRVVIIEYGPATGVFTNYLLQRMTEDSMIIAVELNENFVKYLNENVQDKRLHIHHDSADNIVDIMDRYKGEEADYVISGIPFSLMSSEIRQDIVEKTSQVLRKDGKFLPYQTFFQKDKHLKDYLTNEFLEVNDHFILRNMPPMRVYEAIKREKH